MKEYRKYKDVLLVSDDGEVINLRTNKIIIPDKLFKIRVQVDGVCYREYLSRIVASVFLPNPNNYKYVRHIDGNKSNNHVSNLKWMPKESMGRRIEKIDDVTGEIVKVYRSSIDCMKVEGFCRDTFYKRLDKEVSYNGYRYRRAASQVS